MILIVVYVDDLIMLGAKSLRPCIADIRETITMEDPMPMYRYLGCQHHFSFSGPQGKRLTTCRFEMSGYFQQALEVYQTDTGLPVKSSTSPYVPAIKDEVLDHNLATPGRWQRLAPHFLMKLLYGARMAHPGLSLGINRLTRVVSKWNAECDRRMHRLYEFLAGTDYVLDGMLSQEDLDICTIDVWADSDLNGDLFDTKSTGGCFIELAGSENRGMPLTWGAIKGEGTSVHTQDAETVSMSKWVKSDGIALQHIFQVLLNRPVVMRLMEDNDATITAVQKGYSPSLRHLVRAQRVSLGFLHELTNPDPESSLDTEGEIVILRADTDDQKGDMFTKELDVAAFHRALDMIRMTNIKKK